MQGWKKWVLAGAVAVLAGCATPRQFVQMPDTSIKPVDPEQVRVYVVRSQAFGGGVKMEVWDGPTMIGETLGKSYLCWDRAPGTMTLASHAENKATIDVHLQKGMTYYIWQQVNMGFWKARTSLENLDQVRGRELLEQCKPCTVELNETK